MLVALSVDHAGIIIAMAHGPSANKPDRFFLTSANHYVRTQKLQVRTYGPTFYVRLTTLVIELVKSDR